MTDWSSYKVDPKYLKQYQWLGLPSTFAIIFVALTKGIEGIGFWPTLLLGWFISNFVWFTIFSLTIENKSPANKKQYYFALFIFQILFVGLCIYYVLSI